MLKLGLFAGMLFVANIISAQEKLSENKIQMGKPYPVVDADEKNYFTYNDLVIGVKITDNKFTLQTYNTNKLTLEKIKVYEDFPKGFQLEEFVELNDRFFLFYSLWDKSKQKEQLFAREIDINSCSFKEKGKLVFDVAGKISGSSVINKGFYTDLSLCRRLLRFSFFKSFLCHFHLIWPFFFQRLDDRFIIFLAKVGL